MFESSMLSLQRQINPDRLASIRPMETLRQANAGKRASNILPAPKIGPVLKCTGTIAAFEKQCAASAPSRAVIDR